MNLHCFSARADLEAKPFINITHVRDVSAHLHSGVDLPSTFTIDFIELAPEKFVKAFTKELLNILIKCFETIHHIVHLSHSHVQPVPSSKCAIQLPAVSSRSFEDVRK